MQGVIGAFRELDAAVDAIEALKKGNLGALRDYTPTPRHELEEAIGARPTPVRRFPLIAGLLGVTSGYWIPKRLSAYWPSLAADNTNSPPITSTHLASFVHTM